MSRISTALGYPSIVVGNFSNEMLGLFRNQGKAQGLFIDEAPTAPIGLRPCFH